MRNFVKTRKNAGHISAKYIVHHHKFRRDLRQEHLSSSEMSSAVEKFLGFISAKNTFHLQKVRQRSKNSRKRIHKKRLSRSEISSALGNFSETSQLRTHATFRTFFRARKLLGNISAKNTSYYLTKKFFSGRKIAGKVRTQNTATTHLEKFRQRYESSRKHLLEE